MRDRDGVLPAQDHGGVGVEVVVGEELAVGGQLMVVGRHRWPSTVGVVDEIAPQYLDGELPLDAAL